MDQNPEKKESRSSAQVTPAAGKIRDMIKGEMGNYFNNEEWKNE